MIFLPFFLSPSQVPAAELSLRRCMILPIMDSVGGAIGFKVFEEVEKYLKKSEKPVLEHPGDDYIDIYNDFYDAVLEEEPEMANS